MLLSEICIKRPVFAMALNLVLIIAGLFSIKSLAIMYFPALNVPIATIVTRYPGASPELIEQEITNKVEGSIALIEGLDSLSSNSYNGVSYVYARFSSQQALEKNINSLRDKLAGLVPELPEDVKPPYVSTGGSAQAVLTYGMVDNSRTPEEIGNYVFKYIRPLIQQLPGVGSVGVYGTSSYALRIWLMPARMAAFNIMPSDIKDALTNNNISFSAGTIRSINRNYVLVSDTKLKSVDEFKNIIIREDPNLGSVKIQDIAQVALGTRSLDLYPMKINGKSAVQLQISPRDIANPITVAKEVATEINKIKQQLPAGMSLELLQDRAKFLQNSIDDTINTIFEAILLVVIVVYLFLGSVRASLIPIVTIPVCIISAFAFINLLGFSINIMTLLALVLAIGLVVDDAIVMVENIHSYLEKGESPLQAALKGSKEITFAIIAMTITLAVVYAPIGFAEGVSAEIFKQFAFTLAISVIISGFVALTLSPMMCSYILAKAEEGRVARIVNNIFNNLVIKYKSSLNFILEIKNIVLIIILIIAGLGGVIFYKMPSTFLPIEDTGVFDISLSAPSGSNLNYTEKYVDQVESILSSIKEVSFYYLHTYNESSYITVVLKPYKETQKTTKQVMDKISVLVANVPGVTTHAYMPPPVTVGDSNAGVSIYYTSDGSYEKIKQEVDPIVAKLQQYPGLNNVKQSLHFDSQNYELSINRDLAANLGIKLNTIADTVRMLFAGMHITDLQDESSSYPVLVQMNQKDLTSFQAVEKIFLRANNSKSSNQTNGSISNMVSLSSLITLTPKVSQNVLQHYQQVRTSVISGDLSQGYSLGEVGAYLNTILPTLIPAHANYAFGGALQQYFSSSGNMIQLFILSIIFIYLVLAAQFESFIDPLIILTVVPLSIVGAVFALKLTNNNLSLFTNIGFVTLIGLISKHGILITQFANDLKDNGVATRDAILQAASQRLRPILMTTFAMVLGALPLAFATGAGSLSRQEIGITIVGGLSIGTIFSLYIIPISYLYFDKVESWFSVRDLVHGEKPPGADAPTPFIKGGI